MTPALSIVVIGRNEGARLACCLDSLAGLRTSGTVQVLYVDSGSTDGSPEHATARGVELLRVRPERPSAAIGRNAGWRQARAPFVLFLDGDTEVHPDFVHAAMPAFADPRIAIVWGHRREQHPERSIYNRILDLDWVYAPGLSDFCGGDALVRREALESVGGFDERLIAGEEPEMCRRLRGKDWKILHIDEPMTRHDLAMTRVSQYWRRAVRAGYAYAEIATRFRNSGMPLWQREVRHNAVRGSALVGGLVGAMLASVWLRSFWPVGLLAILLGVAAVRTAWRARWKSSDRFTLLLYGLHSWVQHVPILFGQIRYHADRWTGRRRGLIEYKEAHR